MRYYSTTAGEMVLQVAIAAGDTTIVVDTTAGLPVAYPYSLLIDHGSNNEEVVDVTAAAGATLTVTRGRDGTVAQSHAFGAKLRHGVTARDFRESREHEAATVAHGTTGVVVGTTDTQTLDNKTFQPDGDHPAITVRRPSGTTTVVDFRDDTDARVGTFNEGGLNTFDLAGINLVTILWGGSASLFRQLIGLQIRSEYHGIVGTVIAGATGRFLRLMNGAVEIFYVAANGDLGARAGAFASNVAVTGNVTATGSVTATGTVGGTNITTLTTGVADLVAADTALDVRLDALEAAPTAAACAYGTGFATATTGPAATVVRRNGLVTVSAKIVRSSGVGTTAFTIPVGYRPNVTHYTPNAPLAAVAWNAGTTEGPGFIPTIDPATGVVTLSDISNGLPWGTSTFIQISGSYHV